MRTRTRQVAALLAVVAVLDVALAYLAMNVGRILNNVSQVLTANGSNLVAPADYTVQMVAAIIVAVAALAMAGALVRRPTQFRLSLAIAVAGAQAVFGVYFVTTAGTSVLAVLILVAPPALAALLAYGVREASTGVSGLAAQAADSNAPVIAASFNASPGAASMRVRRTPLVAVAVGAVALVAVAGFLVLSGGKHTVTGLFQVSSMGSGCQGQGGYSDIGPGTPATLKDENGKLLASTVLGKGTGSYPCTFTLTFADVPDNAAFYRFEVGRRGEISSSHADMVKNNWTVGASLGN